MSEWKSTLETAVLPCAGAAVPALLRCMQSPHRGLAKEAAWAVSNIAGSPGRSGVDALLAAGGATVITNTLKEAAFDIRKEAAYAVANLCAGEFSLQCSAHTNMLCSENDIRRSASKWKPCCRRRWWHRGCGRIDGNGRTGSQGPGSNA